MKWTLTFYLQIVIKKKLIVTLRKLLLSHDREKISCTLLKTTAVISASQEKCVVVVSR